MKTIPPLQNADDCLAFALQNNPRNEPLTIEKLLTFPGCENYTPEEAENIVQSLEQLAIIAFEAVNQNKTYHIDNQYSVSSKQETDTIPITLQNTKNKAA